MPHIELENGELLVIKAVKDLPPPDIGDDKKIAAVISTEAIDQDGDIIHQGKNKKGAGWVLDHYNKIPLVLWQHNRDMMNLSSPETRVKVVKHPELGRVLKADPIVFDEGDMVAEMLKGKVERRVIRETSVGYKSITSEVRRGKEHQYLGREFYEQKLIEFSFANRGSNMETDTEIDAKMQGLLEKFSHHQEVQGGSDAAIAELKEEIKDLEVKLNRALEAIKFLGDDVSSCEERFEVIQKAHDRSTRRSELIKELHGALKQFGTATGG